ncbi:DNA damage repair [Pyrrhoderma noxium]|uniref:DNA damage repair n=1 Tax=Pyrrhoderma noxium TaxID=2282107 RepID=A0A286UUL7_9AGAM|nr:DNA damage repair [Pyrrhoderma noxium]
MTQPPRKIGGLYGGIQFSSSSVAPQSSFEPLPQEKEKPTETLVTRPITEVTTSENTPAGPEATTSKPTAGWSAALAFAPVRRGPKQKPKASNTIRSLPAGAQLTEATTAVSSTQGSISSTAIVSAAPIINVPEQQKPAEPERPNTLGWGKKIKPPSMVLDDDVNGFKSNSRKGNATGGGKRKGKKNKNAPAVPTWDPSEAYNPTRPNDYHEYKSWKKRDHEERRERLAEERRQQDRKRYRSGSYSGSEYSYSDNDERPKKNARWEDEEDYERNEPPAVVNASMTGDEAYARRLAMSRGVNPPPAAETGEEAYQRRLAMSQSQRYEEPPSTTSFVEVENQDASVARETSPETSLSYNPFAPPSVPPPPEEAPTVFEPVKGVEYEARVKNSRDAAAAIAARLAKLAGSQASESAGEQEPAPNAGSTEIFGGEEATEPVGFAARMMAKWGHKEGQGLGASGDGIINALTVEKIEQEGKGKGKNKGKDPNIASKEKKGMGALASGARGRIVNANEDAKAQDVEDEELRAEIGDECSKNGVVQRVLVHLVQPALGDGPDAVRVFVVFGGPAAAWKTVRELDGRFFGGGLLGRGISLRLDFSSLIWIPPWSD